MIPKYRRPAHPGKILLLHFLEPMEISQSEFVKHLDGSWTNSKLSEIIHEKRGITVGTAIDFSIALGTTPEFWLNLQMHYSEFDRKFYKSDERFSSGTMHED